MSNKWDECYYLLVDSYDNIERFPTRQLPSGEYYLPLRTLYQGHLILFVKRKGNVKTVICKKNRNPPSCSFTEVQNGEGYSFIFQKQYYGGMPWSSNDDKTWFQAIEWANNNGIEHFIVEDDLKYQIKIPTKKDAALFKLFCLI